MPTALLAAACFPVRVVVKVFEVARRERRQPPRGSAPRSPSGGRSAAATVPSSSFSASMALTADGEVLPELKVAFNVTAGRRLGSWRPADPNPFGWEGSSAPSRTSGSSPFTCGGGGSRKRDDAGHGCTNLRICIVVVFPQQQE